MILLIFKMTLYTLVNEKGKSDKPFNFNPLDRSAVVNMICTVDVNGVETQLAFEDMEEAETLAAILNENAEEAYFSPRLVSPQYEEGYRIDLASGRVANFKDAVEKMVAPKSFLRRHPYAVGFVAGAAAFGLLEYLGVFEKLVELFK